VVAASGPSLTAEVAAQVRLARIAHGWNVIAVQDAYQRMPWADVLYGCDSAWWNVHDGCPGFKGEKWSSHEQDPNPRERHMNDKREVADRYDLSLVRGLNGDEFSLDPNLIRYGSNSGFQALNLAILKGCRRIVLVGYDMRCVSGKSHFFGDHPQGLQQNQDEHYRRYAVRFERAWKSIRKPVDIINATPDSALTCFPMMPLYAALGHDHDVDRHRGLHRDGPEPYAFAN
jgi:hypothetical protein